MSQELGKIDRPEANEYQNKRKIYFIPLIYSGEKIEDDILSLINLYWKQVAEHIENLENKIGEVKHIYYESISNGDEEGLKRIEKLNPKAYEILRQRYINKAKIEPLEDKELLEEHIDWQRCLFIGLISQTVAETISDNFIKCSKKRYEYIGKQIDNTLRKGEAGILFINESNMIQFPSDIEVFHVRPPALNDIYKWLRDMSTKSGDATNKDDSNDSHDAN